MPFSFKNELSLAAEGLNKMLRAGNNIRRPSNNVEKDNIKVQKTLMEISY